MKQGGKVAWARGGSRGGERGKRGSLVNGNTMRM